MRPKSNLKSTKSLAKARSRAKRLIMAKAASSSSTRKPAKRSHPSLDREPSSSSPPITEYGALIIDLVRYCPLVSPRDLIPLRAVSKSYRDDIDRLLVKHIRVITIGKKVCVFDAFGQKLPGLAPLTTTKGDALQHTTTVDIEKMSQTRLKLLKPFLPNVVVIRLPANDRGLHMYQPPAIGNAHTMVVLPSFIAQMGDKKLSSRKVPKGIIKLVQHLFSAVDGYCTLWRGPVLFSTPGVDVTQEVWVFTHYGIKVSWQSLGYYDDRALDASDALFEKLCNVTVSRLNSGKTSLTLVDGDSVFGNICEAYELWRSDSDDDTRVDVPVALRDLLTAMGARNLSKLYIKTWDEYAATLTAEEAAAECLSEDYVTEMEAIANEYYSPLCEKCWYAHRGTCTSPLDLDIV